MRRPAQSTSLKTIFWIVGSLAVLAAVGGWAVMIFSDPFRGLEKADLRAYAESAKSFRGGTYVVEGVIDDQIAYQAGKGRLVGVRAESVQGPVFFPLLFPDALGSFNLQKGQGLMVRVRGDGRGLLVVEKVRKQ